jgi:DNA-directed RNA polymerases I and III subunit RPAC2
VVPLTCSPDVEFCGYSIPHPSEPKLNLRIQTYGKHNIQRWLMAGEEGKTAVDALEKGLDDLMALCEVVEDKFQVALEDKRNRMDVE